MTDDATPTPTEGPSVSMKAVLERYARELSTMTHRALVAEALVEALSSEGAS